MAELLVSLKDGMHAFGAAPLFENVSFGIFEGDHIGLVGPNGSGKTTLLRILAGLEEPLGGTRAARKRLRIGYVEQDPRFEREATVETILRDALERDAKLRGEKNDPHEHDARISVALSQAGFDDPSQSTATLSGGWRKRLAIAREVARAPELLLLDEPTNHLDLDGILWLEELLPREPEAFVAVSHDRYFLESIASRTIELNRAFALGIFDVEGNYSRHLQKKDEFLEGQAAYQESLRNKVRGELEWLSRKAKARTRKAQARIDEAGRLQGELRDLDLRSRAASSGVSIDFSATSRRTRELIVAKDVAKRYDDRTIVSGLSVTLSPGTRLGLLGGNGSGKSTILKMFAGSIEPSAGTIRRAEKLKIVMFDQHRARLDPTVSLQRTLAPHGDSVIFQDRSIHVAGWAKKFLFHTDQLETPVGRLSGGEQARAVIARLMLEPADVLLLDEPTNDLDIPTLEVLEESLLEFPGALVLVTHDRYLLDRVSTTILAIAPDDSGRVVPCADCSQWESIRDEFKSKARSSPTRGEARPPSPPPPSPPKTRKLSYKDQREWDQMEARVLAAEKTLEACRAKVADPAVMSDYKALMAANEELDRATAEVNSLYARWAELEALTLG